MISGNQDPVLIAGPLQDHQVISARQPVMTAELPQVSIRLWRADAIVLFDWLMSTDLNAVPVAHPAQKQALADLLTRLEQETDITGVTQHQIDVAQAEVAGDMGW